MGVVVATGEPAANIAMDRASLPVYARPATRQFRAFNVGIAKTGTRSVAGIFARYRSLHELLFPETVAALEARERGAKGDADFRAFLRWRDALCDLDMDSSSYNCHYVDALAEEFPDAKFVFVIRDCFGWLDSMLNMALLIGPISPEWLVGYLGRFLGPSWEADLADRPADLRRRAPAMAEAGLTYWARTNRFVLEHLAMQRSLIVRASELSDSLPRVAALVGVPAETLAPELSRLHRGRTKYGILHDLDFAWLAEIAEHYCGELMREFFPRLTLADFLRSHPRPS